jgi:hypothetical protein
MSTGLIRQPGHQQGNRIGGKTAAIALTGGRKSGRTRGHYTLCLALGCRFHTGPTVGESGVLLCASAPLREKSALSRLPIQPDPEEESSATGNPDLTDEPPTPPSQPLYPCPKRTRMGGAIRACFSVSLRVFAAKFIPTCRDVRSGVSSLCLLSPPSTPRRPRGISPQAEPRSRGPRQSVGGLCLI